jgi:hypothetical protein
MATTTEHNNRRIHFILLIHCLAQLPFDYCIYPPQQSTWHDRTQLSILVVSFHNGPEYKQIPFQSFRAYAAEGVDSKWLALPGIGPCGREGAASRGRVNVMRTRAFVVSSDMLGGSLVTVKEE